MQVAIEQEPSQVITVRVSGIISAPEWLSLQKEVAKLLRKSEPALILVVAENFYGWVGDDWNDMSFQLQHDHQIDRLAIVVAERWKDKVLLFAGKGFRRFEIRYFPPSQMPQARAWLTSGG